MTSAKKNAGEDPRVGSFADMMNTALYEHIMVQVSGEVSEISETCITIKKGNDEVDLIIDKESPFSIIRVIITKDGDKKSEEMELEDVKKGDLIKANLTMMPSGDWQIIGLSVRVREEE
jgi:hypothetical protein